MGANDTGEQLAAAKEECIRLEAEVEGLKGAIADAFNAGVNAVVKEIATEQSVAVFKAAWHLADKTGLEGKRVEMGLRTLARTLAAD